MLHLENWALPEWHPVSCHQKLQKTITCVLSYTAKRRNTSAMQTNIACAKEQIILGSFCLQFVQSKKKGGSLKDFTLRNIILYPDIKHCIKRLLFLFNAVAAVFPPIVSAHETDPHKITQILTHKYSGIINNIYHTQTMLNNLREKEFLMSEYNENLGVFLAHFTPTAPFLDKFGNMFLCSETEEYVSTKFVFDGKADCGQNDLSDELGSNCKGMQCRRSKENKKECSFLFFKENDQNCVSFPQNIKDMDTQIVQKWTKSSEVSFGFTQFHCKSGQPETHTVSDICVYRVDAEGFVVPCRAGSHMESCELFTCNKKFKCPGYYCLPYGYVCDGKWDCPFGADEETSVCSSPHRCKHMFKCRSSNMLCVHVDDVCDNYSDCPLGDDEALCQLKLVQCPHFCNCLNFAISCADNRFMSFALSEKLPHLSLRIFNTSLSTVGILGTFPSLRFAHLSKNRIDKLCNGHVPLIELIHFDASQNNISDVETECFKLYSNISHIKLKVNHIHVLHQRAFSNLTDLHSLDLSNNSINKLRRSHFHNLLRLRKLSLVGNPLQHIDVEVFVNLMKLSIVETEDHRVCCVAPPASQCSAVKAWYASCKDIFPKHSMVISISVVCAVVFLTNVSTMIWEMILLYKRQAVPYNMTVLSVNFSDLVCANYFLLLLIGHEFYRGTYMVNEKQWTCGFACHIAFSLSMLFSLVSPTLLVIFSFSRLSVVKYPFDSSFKESSFVAKVLAIACGSCVVLSIITDISYRLSYHQVPTGLCLHTADPPNTNHLVKTLTLFTSTYQILSIKLIAVFYTKLILSLMKKSVIDVTQGNKPIERPINKTMIFQLVVVTLSNLICWLPPGVIFVTFAFLPQYPLAIIFWTTIAVLPINSIVNPVTFFVLNVRGCIEEKRE